MRAYMQYVRIDGYVFRWSGGEYINVGHIDECEEFRSIDCVNVWDHASGAPAIPVTLDAFQAQCDAYGMDGDE